MMNGKTRDFIEQNREADVRRLALQGGRHAEVDLPLALRQIAGWQVACRKLPSWAACGEVLYPAGLSMEQCSSEQTARYKADVCRRLTAACPQPRTLVDLTGGFGVDFMLMSEGFSRAIYVEQNADLFEVASANFRAMGRQVDTVCTDGIDFLHGLQTHATVIFLDPARRDGHGGRTYGIADCTPNVLDVSSELLERADFVILKLSPMLDWRKAVQDLGERHVREVHIVSVQNECKELLIVMQRTNDTPLTLFCVNDDTTWSPSAAVAGQAPHQGGASVGQYLYEPNASIMKAGCFSEVAAAFGVEPLAVNSHLFVADRHVADFPGRKFQISAISSMNKQTLKTALKDIRKANVTVRNFPVSVAELRKRLRLSDGGSDYIFATTLSDNRHVLIICKKAMF